MIHRNLLKAALCLFLLPSFLIAGTPGKTYHLQTGVTKDDYIAKNIILRVKPEYRNQCFENSINIASVQHVLQTLGVVEIHKIFPNEKPPLTDVNQFGKKMEDLSLIYIVEYKNDFDLIKTINQFLRTDVFMYAEPNFLPKVSFTPTDPQTVQQYFLTNINAYNAWNVTHGDTSVVIGIVDTGTDLDHPDLAANLKLNYADPVNGLDDDNDGYIDNFNGWDVGENDNTPQVGTCGTCPHGSHVSGCADAVTDNASGVASPGFNCKFMPVKIANANGALTAAYQGIKYAADHGCQIINCSWGGSGGGDFGQNIINYAVNNKNSSVIVAAGNNSSSSLFYPAAFENVLAIASTDETDRKSWFSNYGSYIDVCAPGSNIFSTISNDAYATESGTSMASPIAAGCAAIIKSYFPTYSANQVTEQLRITADNIDGVTGNAVYAGKLGKGRINLYNALTTSGPAVRYENIDIADNNDNILVGGDTMRISGDFINYLMPTTNLTVTVTCTSPYVTILDGSTLVGALGTLAVDNNSIDPYVIKLSPSVPQNTVLTFTFNYVDGTYTDVQTIYKTVNTDYIDIVINEVNTTNTSKGRLCYNTDGQVDGLGFDYHDDGSMMYESGFMVGTVGQVSDNVRNGAGGTDDDFLPINVIEKNIPSVWSDFDTYGAFNDNNSAAPLNVDITHRSMSWNPAPFSKFHIFEYTIKNTGANSLNAVYAGIFSDWDIQTYANNKIAEDPSLKMGYAYCTDAGGYYGGVKLLSSGGFTHYALDNITGGGGGIDISGGYTDAQKYNTLSTNRSNAGIAGAGNDVIDVVGTGPFTILPGDSIVVAFAMLAGDDVSDIQNSAAQAQIKYDIVTSVSENNNQDLISFDPYPNPSTDKVTIPLYLKKTMSLKLSVYELTGKIISERTYDNMAGGVQNIDLSLKGLANGLYMYRLSSEEIKISGLVQKQ